eukprot:TRINITY_DN13764_c0_g1_i3.p1 TRINITY_DN13764_c0_g1~~TRINITY_DN13764_c0_g1_i3.p1  ORF type:complete len:455 (-),score=102.82 TRINITY_DN13764_c0_g1_i3:25-1389(-)
MSGGPTDAPLECLRNFYAGRNYSDSSSQTARALARSAARRGLPLFNIGAVSLEDEEKAWAALSDASSMEAELPLPGMEVEAIYGHRFFDAVVLAASSASVKVRWHFDGTEDELRPDEVRRKPPAAASSSSSCPVTQEEEVGSDTLAFSKACSSMASNSGGSILASLRDDRRLARGSVGTSARLAPPSMSGPRASFVAPASEPSSSSSTSGTKGAPAGASPAASSSLSSSPGRPGSKGDTEDMHEQLVVFLSRAHRPRHAEKRKRLLRNCASEGRVFGDGLKLRPEAVEAAIRQVEKELGVIKEENHQSSWKGSNSSSWWASSQSEQGAHGDAQEVEAKVEMIWDERKQKFVHQAQSKDEAGGNRSSSDLKHEAAKSRSNGTSEARSTKTHEEVNCDDATDRRISMCVSFLQQSSDLQKAMAVVRKDMAGKIAETAIARLATKTASDQLGLGRFQ